MSGHSVNQRDGEVRAATWLVLWRALLLVALAASGALYVQYLNPAESPFCSLSSGCETVRRSGIGYFGSRFFSLPLVGLGAFGVVLWSTVFARSEKWPVWLSMAGAVCALGFIGVQAFYIHAFCSLCLIVDVSAVGAALFAFGDLRTRQQAPRRDPLRAATWIVLGALFACAPGIWAKVRPAPPVPDVIRALYVPDKINVVEFADFECPYCRKFQPVLRRVMKTYPAERVHFVRKHVPLEVHPDARAAARAVICAGQQGKGEILGDRLVQIDLSPVAERRAAVGLGVDAGAFDRCLASSAPDQRIATDTALLKTAGMVGLPTTYVGGKRLLGVVSEAALRDAFDRAARGDSSVGLPAWLFVTLLLSTLLLVVWLGRAPRVMLPDERSA